MVYFYLFIAIIAEVVSTIALKASNEFTRLVPSLVVILGDIVAFYFMTLVLRVMPVGITYAIWSALGIVLVTLIGFFFYKQPLDLPAIIGIALIISGVVVIDVFSTVTTR